MSSEILGLTSWSRNQPQRPAIATLFGQQSTTGHPQWKAALASVFLHVAGISALFLFITPVASVSPMHRKEAEFRVQVIHFPSHFPIIRTTAESKNRSAGRTISYRQVAGARIVKPHHAVLHRAVIGVSHAVLQTSQRFVKQTLIRPELPKTTELIDQIPSFLVIAPPQLVPYRDLRPVSNPQKTGFAASLHSPRISWRKPPEEKIPAPPSISNETVGGSYSATVLALSSRPLPLPKDLPIPPLNQVAQTGTPHSQANNSPLHATKQATLLRAGVQNSDSPEASMSEAGSEALLTQESHGLSQLDVAMANSLAAANIHTGGVSAPTPANSVVTKNSSSGRFDVIIVQSTVAADIPGASDLLHGKPVYTVYLKVQSAREWILEYCVPESSDSTDEHPAVVVLTNPTHIEPPYPLVTVSPTGRPSGTASFLLFHGTIDVEGRALNFVDTGSEDSAYAQSVVEALRHWKFRPATRDGVPVQVEAVLVIPSAN